MRTIQPISSEPVELGYRDAVERPVCPSNRPLVVDLDEVLLRPHLLADAAFSEIVTRPQSLPGILTALLRGRQAFRQRIGRSTHFDPSRLQYDKDVTALLLRTLGEGRPVYLASGRYPRQLVDSVAQHLGIFSGWSALDESGKLDVETARLQQSLQAAGFDYLGSDAEIPPSASRLTRPVHDTESADLLAGWRVWAKLLRVHQYAKNALVLVPLLTAHQFAMLPAAKALLAAIAFSLCASGGYILNDLVDIAADRAHASKRNRPLASGAISPTHGAIAMGLLLTASLAIATAVSWIFLGVLVIYLGLSAAYSFHLKRIMLADVVTLAMLYTIRVIGGAAAINVVMSEWLLAFSLFVFMSLALVKRFIELAALPEGSQATLANRGYQAGDQSIVAILAATAGFNAVVIFTLYISSDAVRALYARPQVLWLACPILLYWVARILMLAHRRVIDDDPVVFALKDRFSWFSLIAIGMIMLAAI